LLAELAADGRPTLAVTHRGVIRAIYARAIGWDMTGEPPHGVDLYALQMFELAADGMPSIDRLNVPLALR
jgi:probable phosphoglycerate mutase